MGGRHGKPVSNTCILFSPVLLPLCRPMPALLSPFLCLSALISRTNQASHLMLSLRAICTVTRRGDGWRGSWWREGRRRDHSTGELHSSAGARARTRACAHTRRRRRAGGSYYAGRVMLIGCAGSLFSSPAVTAVSRCFSTHCSHHAPTYNTTTPPTLSFLYHLTGCERGAAYRRARRAGRGPTSSPGAASPHPPVCLSPPDPTSPPVSFCYLCRAHPRALPFTR